MSSPIPEETSPHVEVTAPSPQPDLQKEALPDLEVPSRVGSVVRIITPNSRRSSTNGVSILHVTQRSLSADPKFFDPTPRSVQDAQSQCPSQQDLIKRARRRSRRRKRPSSSLSISSIQSPYGASLNWSSYNCPFTFRSPYTPRSISSRSNSGYNTPMGLRGSMPKSPPEEPCIAEYPGRAEETGGFDINATFRTMSLSGRAADLRDSHTRSFSRLSRATNGSTPSGIGHSRVSLELSGNISIELQTPRIDAPTKLEVTHPGKENLRRARLMSRLIVGLAQGSYSKLDQYFHKFDIDAPYGKKLITQRAPSVFDVRLFLKNPMPSGYFEMIPTFQRNAPEGYVLYRMSKALTVEDRSLLKDMWGPCLLEESFLTPSILHPWIAKGVKKAVKELQGIKIGRSTYGFLISYKAPEVVVIVRAISEATLVSSVFTLHIIPAIIETGRPKISGFHLRMPLPPVLPYSRAGMNVMRQVEAELEEGKLSWYLEGRCIEPPAGKSEGSAYKHRKKDRHAGCHDPSHAHHSSPPPRRDSKTWVITLESLEKRLLELSLKTIPMQAARKGFSAFDAMFETKEELWNVLGKAQLTSLKLWTIKRTALRNKDKDDWMRALLRLLLETLDKKFGTYFLQPSINFLSETEPKPMDLLLKVIKDTLKESEATSAAPTPSPSLPKASTARTQLVHTPRAKPKPHNPVAYSWG